MKFATSVHALTEWGQPVKSFRQVLKEAGELGFTGIMLMHIPGQEALTAENEPAAGIIDLEQSDPAAVLAAVREAGLEPACVYQGLMRVADAQEAQKSAEALAGLISLAKTLGSDVVIPNAGVMPKALMPFKEKEADLQRLAEVMSTALENASPNTRIAPDIHYNSVLETVADCRRYFELVPDLRAGIALNIGHMTTCRQEGWRLLEEYPERIHVVAWKDHLLKPPNHHPHAVYSVELGTGDSPFERYAAALGALDEKCRHLITFEHVPLAEKAPALGRSLAYMQRLLGGR